MANDVMVSYSNHDLATTFLSEDYIRQRCPLAFAENPTNEKVSDKYVVAKTIDVIRDMERLGWKVVDARQRKGHKDASGRFSYHMIVFQNPEVCITKTVGDEIAGVECYPRIILTNSHDGLNCFKFMVGLYRVVCSNGLVISSDEFADLKIRHIHYTFEELKALCNKVVEELPEQVELMTKMKATELSDEQMLSMALKMYKVRKGVDLESEEEVVVDVDEETLRDMLDPQREEDKSFDLWTVFNVLQEKVVKGGYTYFEEGMKKPRKMRKITSFVKDLDINMKMFEIAKSFLVVREDVDEQEQVEE